jgi:Na+/H+-dicarboxylate symporter
MGCTTWVGYLVLGKRLKDLLRHIKTPLLIAFTTTSSEAVFPKLVEELEKFGAQNKIISFTLPLGYSFNLDGSMMYMTFASLFIAQVYDIHMPIEKQLLMLLVLMLTSKGVAGVPRASLISSGYMFYVWYSTRRYCLNSANRPLL